MVNHVVCFADISQYYGYYIIIFILPIFYIKNLRECRSSAVTLATSMMIVFDYAVEYKAVKNIFIDLGVMELAQKEKSSSSSVTNGKESKVTPIKINKPDPIKFSGQPRDFATFKREFEAIVVPRRDPSDVGFHLKQAVPSKHRHLLDNIDLSKYEKMMRTHAGNEPNN